MIPLAARRALAPTPTRPEPGRPDPAQTRQVLELKYTSPLLACCFDRTGQYLFFAAQDNSVQRADLGTSKLTPLLGHRSWVRSLVCHPTQDLLFSGCYAGQVLCWSTTAETPKPVRTLDAHRGWVRALAVSPDGTLLATCGNDHLVKLWATATGALVRELRGHDSHVYNVAFHPGGTALVSGDHRGLVKEWDIATGAVRRQFDASVLFKYDPQFRADIGGVRSIAFNGDGSLLACGGITEVTNAFAGIGKPVVVLLDWQSGQRKQLLRPKEAFQGAVWGLAFHPDGFLIGAGGGNGGALWFWKADDAQSFASVKLPTNARDLALHPDRLRLGLAFFDNMARVYSLSREAKGGTSVP